MAKKRARPRNILPERRSSDRFPIERELGYRIASDRGVSPDGRGRTVDMSSGGISFTAEPSFGIGNRLELSVDWPVQLNDSVRLKLVALGRIIRSETFKTAIEIEKYEFRTQGARGLFTLPTATEMIE